MSYEYQCRGIGGSGPNPRYEILNTKHGVIIIDLDDAGNWCSDKEVLNRFVNSFTGTYDCKFSGSNKEEFREETLHPRMEKLEEEYKKLLFIDEVISKKLVPKEEIKQLYNDNFDWKMKRQKEWEEKRKKELAARENES